MDKRKSKSMPLLLPYHPTPPILYTAHSPRTLERKHSRYVGRGWTTLPQSQQSRTYYINGTPNRIFASNYSYTPTQFPRKMILLTPKGRLERSMTRCTSNLELSKTCVFRSTEDLRDHSLRKAVSTEELSPQMVTKVHQWDSRQSESGVSFNTDDVGSLMGPEDDRMSLCSFGSSSAFFEITGDSECGERTDLDSVSVPSSLGGHERALGVLHEDFAKERDDPSDVYIRDRRHEPKDYSDASSVASASRDDTGSQRDQFFHSTPTKRDSLTLSLFPADDDQQMCDVKSSSNHASSRLVTYPDESYKRDVENEDGSSRTSPRRRYSLQKKDTSTTANIISDILHSAREKLIKKFPTSHTLSQGETIQAWLSQGHGDSENAGDLDHLSNTSELQDLDHFSGVLDHGGDRVSNVTEWQHVDQLSIDSGILLDQTAHQTSSNEVKESTDILRRWDNDQPSQQESCQMTSFSTPPSHVDIISVSDSIGALENQQHLQHIFFTSPHSSVDTVIGIETIEKQPDAETCASLITSDVIFEAGRQEGCGAPLFTSAQQQQQQQQQEGRQTVLDGAAPSETAIFQKIDAADVIGKISAGTTTTSTAVDISHLNERVGNENEVDASTSFRDKNARDSKVRIADSTDRDVGYNSSIDNVQTDIIDRNSPHTLSTAADGITDSSFAGEKTVSAVSVVSIDWCDGIEVTGPISGDVNVSLAENNASILVEVINTSSVSNVIAGSNFGEKINTSGRLNKTESTNNSIVNLNFGEQINTGLGVDSTESTNNSTANSSFDEKINTSVHLGSTENTDNSTVNSSFGEKINTGPHLDNTESTNNSLVDSNFGEKICTSPVLDSTESTSNSTVEKINTGPRIDSTESTDNSPVDSNFGEKICTNPLLDRTESTSNITVEKINADSRQVITESTDSIIVNSSFGEEINTGGHLSSTVPVSQWENFVKFIESFNENGQPASSSLKKTDDNREIVTREDFITEIPTPVSYSNTIKQNELGEDFIDDFSEEEGQASFILDNTNDNRQTACDDLITEISPDSSPHKRSESRENVIDKISEKKGNASFILDNTNDNREIITSEHFITEISPPGSDSSTHKQSEWQENFIDEFSEKEGNASLILDNTNDNREIITSDDFITEISPPGSNSSTHTQSESRENFIDEFSEKEAQTSFILDETNDNKQIAPSEDFIIEIPPPGSDASTGKQSESRENDEDTVSTAVTESHTTSEIVTDNLSNYDFNMNKRDGVSHPPSQHPLYTTTARAAIAEVDSMSQSLPLNDSSLSHKHGHAMARAELKPALCRYVDRCEEFLIVDVEVLEVNISELVSTSSQHTFQAKEQSATSQYPLLHRELTPAYSEACINSAVSGFSLAPEDFHSRSELSSVLRDDRNAIEENAATRFASDASERFNIYSHPEYSHASLLDSQTLLQSQTDLGEKDSSHISAVPDDIMAERSKSRGIDLLDSLEEQLSMLSDPDVVSPLSSPRDFGYDYKDRAEASLPNEENNALYSDSTFGSDTAQGKTSVLIHLKRNEQVCDVHETSSQILLTNNSDEGENFSIKGAGVLAESSLLDDSPVSFSGWDTVYHAPVSTSSTQQERHKIDIANEKEHHTSIPARNSVRHVNAGQFWQRPTSDSSDYDDSDGNYSSQTTSDSGYYVTGSASVVSPMLFSEGESSEGIKDDDYDNLIDSEPQDNRINITVDYRPIFHRSSISQETIVEAEEENDSAEEIDSRISNFKSSIHFCVSSPTPERPVGEIIPYITLSGAELSASSTSSLHDASDRISNLSGSLPDVIDRVSDVSDVSYQMGEITLGIKQHEIKQQSFPSLHGDSDKSYRRGETTLGIKQQEMVHSSPSLHDVNDRRSFTSDSDISYRRGETTLGIKQQEVDLSSSSLHDDGISLTSDSDISYQRGQTTLGTKQQEVDLSSPSLHDVSDRMSFTSDSDIYQRGETTLGIQQQELDLSSPSLHDVGDRISLTSDSDITYQRGEITMDINPLEIEHGSSTLHDSSDRVWFTSAMSDEKPRVTHLIDYEVEHPSVSPSDSQHDLSDRMSYLSDVSYQQELTSGSILDIRYRSNLDISISRLSSCNSPAPSDISDGSAYSSSAKAEIKQASDRNVTELTNLIGAGQFLERKNLTAALESAGLSEWIQNNVELFDKLLADFEKVGQREEFRLFTELCSAYNKHDDSFPSKQADVCDDVYRAFTKEDSEKRQNHICLVIEDHMPALRFKRFLRKNHCCHLKDCEKFKVIHKLDKLAESDHQCDVKVEDSSHLRPYELTLRLTPRDSKHSDVFDEDGDVKHFYSDSAYSTMSSVTSRDWDSVSGSLGDVDYSAEMDKTRVMSDVFDQSDNSEIDTALLDRLHVAHYSVAGTKLPYRKSRSQFSSHK